MNATTQNVSDSRAAAVNRLATLRRFLSAEPGNARLRRDVVDTAVAAGEFDYVRELAEQRLASAPADAEAQFDRATALIGLRDYTGALAALQLLDATIPGVRFNSGLCLFMLERHAEALPFFAAGYEAGERDPMQLRFHVQTLHHLGEVDAAVAIANDNPQAISSDAALAGSCALALLDAGDTERSAQCARIALAASPDNVDALVSMGVVHGIGFDMERSRAAFEHVLGLQPENARALVGLGGLAMTTGNFSAAIPYLERGIERMPEHIGSRQTLGWAYLFSGQTDAAEKVFQQALELNHNFCESHGCLAVVAAMRGDRATAERGIEVAERLDRNCLSSKYARSLLMQDRDGARTYLADVIAKIPGQGPKFAELLRQARGKSEG